MDGETDANRQDALNHPQPASREFLRLFGPYPGRAADSGGPRVQHNLVLKFREGTDDQVVTWFEKCLKPVLNGLPGVESFHYGPYSSFEGLNQGFNWGSSLVFRDQYSRDCWIAHQVHEEVVQQLLPLLQDGANSLIAFDYLLPN